MATERVKYLGKRELTIKEFEALDTLNPNIDYNLTDFPQFYITNEQMAYALTCKRLFNIGSTFICSDEGNYSKGHIYQIIGNPKEWKDITDYFTKSETENYVDNKYVGSEYISIDDGEEGTLQAGKKVVRLDKTNVETEKAIENSDKLITSGAVFNSLQNINTQIGDIGTALDIINGEVI